MPDEHNTRNCRTENRAALENDDIERIDRCAEFIAAVLEVRNSLAGDTVTREKSCILGAVTRMSMIYERQETALRDARRHSAAKDEVVAAANYFADMTCIDRNGEWILKAGYDPQIVLDALALIAAEPRKDAERLERLRQITDHDDDGEFLLGQIDARDAALRDARAERDEAIRQHRENLNGARAIIEHSAANDAVVAAARDFLNAPYSSNNYDHKHAVRQLADALARLDAAASKDDE